MTAAPARVRALRTVPSRRCNLDVFDHARAAVLRVDRPGRRNATKTEAVAAMRAIAELAAVVSMRRPMNDPACTAIMDAFTAAVGDWSSDAYHDGRRSCCRQGGAL